MKELIEKLLAYLPTYILELSHVFLHPKTLVTSKEITSEDSFQASLVFLAISTALFEIMVLPLVHTSRDIWTVVGTQSIILVIAVAMTAACLKLCWQLVGGTASTRSFFVVYAYQAGVTLIMLATTLLLSIGLFRGMEPELYTQLQVAQESGAVAPDFSDTVAAQISVLAFLTGCMAIIGWVYLSWGAYRHLNGLSKARSFIAFLLMTPLTLVTSVIMYYIGTAIQ